MHTDNSPIGNRDMAADALSAARLYVDFALPPATRNADIPDDTPPLPIGKVGVIGAGTMGGGIAMNFLNAGIPVTMIEAQNQALERGLATIRRNYDRTASKG